MKLQKNTKIAIAILVIGLVLYVLMSVYISYVEKNVVKNNTYQQYLSENYQFVKKYGHVEDLIYITDVPIKTSEERFYECYYDFRCVTDKGEYDIRLYIARIDGDWHYAYKEISQQ